MFKRHEHWRVRSGQKIWTHKWPTTFPNLDCANSHKICTFCWNFSTSAWFFRLWKVSIKTAGRSKSNLKSFLRRWLNCLAQVSSVSPPASLILLWNMPFSSIKIWNNETHKSGTVAPVSCLQYSISPEVRAKHGLKHVEHVPQCLVTQNMIYCWYFIMFVEHS